MVRRARGSMFDGFCISTMLGPALVILVVLANVGTTTEYTEPTPPIQARIAILKHRLHKETKHLRKKDDKAALRMGGEGEVRAGVVYEDYEYEEGADRITPIMDYDQKKFDELFFLKRVKSTTTTTESGWEKVIGRNQQYAVAPELVTGMDVTGWVQGVTKNLDKPAIDIFYRKKAPAEDCDETPSFKNKQVQWTHCQYVIAPFLTGIKKVVDAPIKLGVEHMTIKRVIEMLSLNTTGFERDDIYAILYQFSNTQIRLFQWDVDAVNLLFITISLSKNPTFKTLKYGLKRIFRSWHLDFNWNVTKLVKQTRLFRPICLNEDIGSSTKSSKPIRYTLPTTKQTGNDCDDSDEETRRKNNEKKGVDDKGGAGNKTGTDAKGGAVNKTGVDDTGGADYKAGVSKLGVTATTSKTTPINIG